MRGRTKIFLADLAHTASVPDSALTVPLGIGYVKAFCDRASATKSRLGYSSTPTASRRRARGKP